MSTSDVLFLERKILAAIENAVHILLVTHQKPDGDALGSVLALSHFLESKGKRHKIFCRTPYGNQFDFLSGIDRVTADPVLFSEKRFDLIIVCDSSDLKYAGVEDHLAALPYPMPTLVNMDHHATNTRFGDWVLVDSTASSTTQVLYQFFQDLSIPVTKEMSTCLLTGIVTDTGGFTNPATTFGSLESSASLLLKGAHYNRITTNLVKNKTIPTLRFWGKVMERLEFNPRLGSALTVIKKEDFSDKELDSEAADGIINFLNNLSGVRFVMLLRELYGGKVKVSFRTTDPSMDVSGIAEYFGGGGHAKASGFSIEGRLVRTKEGWLVV
ncbi:MAG: phosphoesterase RecJ domain-containing protein [Parcubacteria group bacterium Gr01-1014_18]|nr:MAG: phosphoesterase RecJ domain-containing protein [Parcubacteria group bacterium Greene0416_36]TSC81036.1 MAG: phosphoesterase RecJ domain-containing protein [Parcubacteria group bacterium Gr01-1014_18]TSC98958.1 MAG: phosphoesterase RecJ domain-containing protein [Parcubacteria group bacterium Greene1014_20]TSD06750.1 MAG: phosphoesterase RecJ domain-containing protein [Parcubacteria group bacterium Greene0714_2]